MRGQMRGRGRGLFSALCVCSVCECVARAGASRRNIVTEEVGKEIRVEKGMCV